MSTPKHLATIYFYQKETDVVYTYEVYLEPTEMTVKKEDTVIMTYYPTILWINVLKKIGYQESDYILGI